MGVSMSQGILNYYTMNWVGVVISALLYGLCSWHRRLQTMLILKLAELKHLEPSGLWGKQMME